MLPGFALATTDSSIATVVPGLPIRTGLVDEQTSDEIEPVGDCIAVDTELQETYVESCLET